MSCEESRNQLALMLYGELSFDEEDSLQQHLESCGACRAEFAQYKSMHVQLDAAELIFPPQLLQDCRRSLRQSLSPLRIPRVVRGYHRWASLRGWNWKPLGALALVAAGFLGGRFVPARSTDPAALRVRSIEPSPSGQVRMIVEETREHTLSGELDDQRIRDLLVHAASDASDPGVRVETVDLLKSQSQSAQVRSVLLSVLQHDANAGVRLKALEGLNQWASDPEVRKTLSQVVISDTNPGVRTQAVDLLIQKPEPAIVGILQELLAREENNYVRLKCQRVLHEMNASAETF